VSEEHAIRPRLAPRSGRLSRSAEFERVYRHGRSSATRHFVVYVFERPAGGTSRLGLSVSRKVGGAVERNHVKRLLRESFAALAEQVGDGHDLVVVARPGAAELAAHAGLGGVQEALAELLAKAGIIAGAGETA
jgi:ribonuclease P protein component